MTETKILMGMPITIEVCDLSAGKQADAIVKVYEYFATIDSRFSTYKPESEISFINKGMLKPHEYSADMRMVFELSEETRRLTDGYFDISLAPGDSTPAVPASASSHRQYDPSGLVKGWAIYHAGKMLSKMGFRDFYINAGGDIQVQGKNSQGERWSVGIRDPFDKTQQKIVKKIFLSNNEGVATSGTYIRGDHIYDPKTRKEQGKEHRKEKQGSNHRPNGIVSLTVVGPNVYEADRFATAAFAMGKKGIEFMEGLNGLEGYLIDNDGIATMTSAFEKYLE